MAFVTMTPAAARTNCNYCENVYDDSIIFFIIGIGLCVCKIGNKWIESAFLKSFWLHYHHTYLYCSLFVHKYTLNCVINDDDVEFFGILAVFLFVVVRKRNRSRKYFIVESRFGILFHPFETPVTHVERIFIDHFTSR